MAHLRHPSHLGSRHPMNCSGAWTPDDIQYLQEASRMPPAATSALVGWGNNSNNQIGAGPVVNDTYPRRTYNTASFATKLKCFQVAPYINSCSLYVTAEGQLWTWGFNTTNAAGRSGTSPLSIGQVTTPSGVTWKKAQAGGNFILGLSEAGWLYAAGAGSGYALGTGTTSNVTTPTRVGTNTFIDIAADSGGGVAIATDGTLWTWGDNSHGRTGLGLTSGQTTAPTQVGTATDWVACWTGWWQTVAKKSDGTFWACGYNASGTYPFGSLLPGTTNSTLVQIGDSSWKEISFGQYASFIVKNDGTLWGLGHGQVITGVASDQTKYMTPLALQTDKTWKSCVVSSQGGFGIDTDGNLWHVGQRSIGFDDASSSSYRPWNRCGVAPVNSRLSATQSNASMLISLEP